MDVAMKIVFFSIVGFILYVYAGYPVILFILALFRRRSKPDESGELPTVALIISAYNEERIIREKIENSLELDYPEDKLRIIIASDGSLDGTDAIVREYEDRHVILKTFDSREGKSSTLNRTVLGVEEDVLVFSDANAFYRRDALKNLVRNFASGDVGCVVGRLIYLENHSYVGKGEGLYWRYETLLNGLESRLGSVFVATGTIFAIRRELFRPVMRDVANDFQIPAEVASQGCKVVFEKEAVAFERATYFFREEFSRKKRIIIRGMTGFKHLRRRMGSRLRVFQFISRKLLRWWIGPILPLLYIANMFLLDDPFFLAIFILQNIFYLLAIIGALLRRGKVQSKLFFIPFYFVLVNGAALTAILTYLGGSRLSFWEKAETTRDAHEDAPAGPKLRVIEGKKSLAYRADSGKVEKFERIP